MLVIMTHINSYVCKNLDPLQFANRSTGDMISLSLYSALDQLDNKNTYVRLLVINYSLALNITIPSMLIIKLGELGL